MSMRNFLVLSAATCLMVKICSVDAYHGQKQHRGQRQLQAFAKKEHSQTMALKNPPQEINVDPSKTYNSQFMPMMTSSCRPEVDGFFGATFGDYMKIEYGFQIEIQPLSQVMTILDVIENKIVDSILMNSFPVMCGKRSRRRGLLASSSAQEEQTDTVLMSTDEYRQHQQQQRSLKHTPGHPSGYRFFNFEEAGTCQPEVDQVNFCGVISGSLYVYGRQQEGEDASLKVLTYIDKVLTTDDPTSIHSELAGIKARKEYTKVSGTIGGKYFEDANPTSGDGISPVGILLVIIALLLTIAIGYYMYIRWIERKEVDTMIRQKNNPFHPQKFIDYEPDQHSLHPSVLGEEEEDEYEDETVYDEDEDNDECNNNMHLDASNDQGLGGLESFIDELNSLDENESKTSRNSRQSRRSRASEASSRRREEFDRLREKTGLTLTSTMSHMSTQSMDHEFSPYYDEDDKASFANRSAFV